MAFHEVVYALVFMALFVGVGVFIVTVLVRAIRRAQAREFKAQAASERRPQPAPSQPGQPRAGYAATVPPHVPAPTIPAGVPSSLPIKTKPYFLTRTEVSFFAVLESALPEGYRVFPNVRLNDIFTITTRQYGEKQGAYARLRDKHVDFLIVRLPDLRPVMAIELDGASHDNEKQQYRDAVKDAAFRSAHLPLVRLRAEVGHSRDAVRHALAPAIPLPVES